MSDFKEYLVEATKIIKDIKTADVPDLTKAKDIEDFDSFYNVKIEPLWKNMGFKTAKEAIKEHGEDLFEDTLMHTYPSFFSRKDKKEFTKQDDKNLKKLISILNKDNIHLKFDSTYIGKDFDSYKISIDIL